MKWLVFLAVFIGFCVCPALGLWILFRDVLSENSDKVRYLSVKAHNIDFACQHAPKMCFKDFCSQNKIEIKNGIRIGQKRRITLIKDNEKVSVKIRLNDNKQWYYMLGFAMKVFNISYEKTVDTCKLFSLLLPLPESSFANCRKVLMWCDCNELDDIQKILLMGTDICPA